MHIVFLSIPARGHIHPTVPIVEKLLTKGHTVTYFIHNQYISLLPKHKNLSIELYSQDFKKDFYSIGNFFSLGEELLKYSNIILPHLIDKLRYSRVDRIVYDSLCVWGNIVSKVLSVQSICSITTFCLTEKVIAKEPWFIYNIVWSGIKNIQCVTRTQGLLNKLNKKYNTKLYFADIFTNTGDKNICFTSQSLQPYNELFGNNWYFVGPQLPPITIKKKKKIYVSFGTVFIKDKKLYRYVAHVLNTLSTDYEIIFVLGDVVKLSDLPKLNNNIKTTMFADQLQELSESILFITHGGMNSAMESLWCATPMVVLPQMSEQMLVGKVIERNNLGKVMYKHKDLNSIVSAVLTSIKYKNKLQEVRKVLISESISKNTLDIFM